MYKFGTYHLDPERFELRNEGITVPIQPKVLRLLIHLVEHRDRTVTNEELLAALWPNEAVAVGSIKRAVRGARIALGDTGESQATIRTQRGYGYRFVREVHVHPQTPSHEAKSPSSTPAECVSTPPQHPADFISPPNPLVGESMVAEPMLRERSDGERFERAARVSDQAARSADFISGLGEGEAFIGRDQVLQTLSSGLQRAFSGATSCVLISGAPGLGKTRTIEELLALARALGADSWLGRCTEVEGAPAYWPFIQLLREAAHTRGADEFRALLGREGADVLDAMRELRRELPDIPEPTQLGSASARFRLFDGVGVFLQRASERKPIVIAIDDLQSADAASLHLLSFLVQQLQRARLLIVASHRPLPALPPTAAALIEPLVQSSSVRSLELQGWSQHEIARYLEHTTGRAASAELSAQLLEQTAGNPLFVQQAVERGAEPSGPVKLPGGAIEQHLALVSASCRELLGAAAVCGPEFSDALLARVAGQDFGLVREQLARAEACGLIAARPHPLPRYVFTHGLIRQALYERVAPSQRALWHGRAARAIELHGVPDSALKLAEVTHHYVCAAPAHDDGRALVYLERSAESARAALAYEQSAEYFERALHLLQYRAPDPALRLKLLFGRAQALLRAGARSAARAVLLEVVELASELDDHSLRVSASALFASSPESGRVDDTQVQLLERALASLPADDARTAWIEALLAKSLSYASDATRRVALARRARARVREQPDSVLQLQTLTACHQALLGPEHLRERTEITCALIELAHARADAEALLSAFTARIETCAAVGDIDGLDAAVASLQVLAEQVRDPVARWHVALLGCMRATLRSDVHAAHALAEEALHSGAPLDAELARRIYSVQTNLLFRLTGRMAEAEALMRAMALRYPNVYGWTAAVGAIEWELGRRDKARSCLERLMEDGLERVRSEPYLLSGFTAVSDLCCRVGDSAAAGAIYEALLPYGDQHGITHLAAVNYGPMSMYLGLLAECRGHADLAEQHLIEALAAAERTRSSLLINNVRLSFALTLLRAGGNERRTRAAALLSRAWKHATDQRLHGITTLCSRLARRHSLSLSTAPTPSA